MTKDEVIKILKKYKIKCGLKEAEAFTIAIKLVKEYIK